MEWILLLSAILVLGGCKTAPPAAQQGVLPAGCTVQMQELRKRACKAQNLALRPLSSERAIAEWGDLTAELAGLAEQAPTCPNRYTMDPCSKP